MQLADKLIRLFHQSGFKFLVKIFVHLIYDFFEFNQKIYEVLQCVVLPNSIFNFDGLLAYFDAINKKNL